MIRFSRSALFGAALLVFSSALGQAQNIISSGTGTFLPSFRDQTNNDLNSTTYFGWSAGSFDGGTNNELMESPSPTLGAGGLNGSLGQLGTADILSSSNNIYNGTNGRNETLVLNIATNGIAGITGYTTIIIQGLTNSAAGFGDPSALLINQPVFGSINGVEPEFVIGLNSSGYGQWWVKYELEGNQTSYQVDIAINNVGGPTAPLTITQFEVDTQYSTTGFAADSAVAVPEPSAGVLAVVGLGFAIARRKRANK